jgi:putative ABC transport system ATP-binding protein
MINVEQVSKRYGKKANEFTALDAVSFEIPEGVTAAIIGKSGSGKSTLMHLIGGLDHATEGKVIINSKSIADLSDKAIDRFRGHDLGFVFQSFFIEPNTTCYQNVALPLEINDIPLLQRRKLVEDALEQVGLLDKINGKAGNLSGGQKQRLAIARAVVHKPKLILADEPTGNLDSTTGEQIIKLLFDLNKNTGTTLVIVTHDHELAARCQMQIELKDGRLVTFNSGKASKKAKKAKK